VLADQRLQLARLVGRNWLLQRHRLRQLGRFVRDACERPQEPAASG
jgi:hypothetical protein